MDMYETIVPSPEKKTLLGNPKYSRSIHFGSQIPSNGYIYTYIYIYIHIYTYIRIYIHIFTYICIYICIYIYGETKLRW